MPSIWFTGNYEDLSTDRGYQFKFFLEKFGNGYISTFKASAIGMAASAVAIARASENPSTIAWALFAKGMATESVDTDHAEALFEDGLERARSVENGWVGAMCSTRLASLWRRRGAWLGGRVRPSGGIVSSSTG